MACIKQELDRWIDRLPREKRARHEALEATRKAVTGLRKAIVPASKVIATGLLKKVTGIAVDELLNAIDDDSDSAAESVTSATSKSFEAGLDELFKRTLDDHVKRGQSIIEFKNSIGALISLLENSANATLPVFVFIDEVDRCRPTYAIKLLEEVKHIFGIDKICFVVSTNLDQLRESVRAVYGTGFNGHRYLKRFFDSQYTLPDPDYESFAALLFSEESIIKTRAIHSGLPNPQAGGEKRLTALIFSSFGLDLRSQKQVFAAANSVAAVIPKDKSIFLFWLLFLCALRHNKPDIFYRLTKNKADRSSFIEICREALNRDSDIEYGRPPSRYDDNTQKSTKLSEVAWSYYSWSFDQLDKLRVKEAEMNAYSYPASNLTPIVQELPNHYNPSDIPRPSIFGYLDLVRYAGLSFENNVVKN